MRKLKLLFACFLMASIGWVSAQNKTVSGTVVSAEDGQPIIGANVVVKGTTIGTATDADGKFSFVAPSEAKTLVVSYLGAKSQEVNAGIGLQVRLELEQKQLEEVVVTAMGIKRSEKSLGYAATTVKNEELTTSRNTNVTNSLSGKVAGLQVQSTSSDPGAATSVVVRGYGSINGSNQPLYVVDGVPLSNTTLTTSGHAINAGGISNISAEDIESMTILKGAAATALYGSRASNGVIVITTKQGEKSASGRNFSIQYDGGLQLRQVSYLPQLQNEFGQGWNGNQTYIENGSWGPRLDGSIQNYGPIWNGQQLIHKYQALPNNIYDFFDIGQSYNNTIALSGASNDNKLTYYISYSNSHDDGIMPSNKDSYKRNTIAYRSSYQAANWFKVSSSVNFATSSTDVVGSFQGTSVIDGLYEFPRDISLVDKKDLSSAFNTPEAYFTPYGITNPYWAIANNYNHLDSKQVYGKVQADIYPAKNVTLTYRFGYDYTDYDSKIGVPQIALDDALIENNYGYPPSSMNQTGSVDGSYSRSYQLNHDFLANYDNRFGNFSLVANIGFNANERYGTSMAGETTGLSIPSGFWEFNNGSSITSLSEAQTKRRLIGVFGDVTVGYKDMLYLNATARNDWSSTLPITKNNYFYPGVTLSWLFTELIPKNNVLSFGKVRLAYGKTGNDAGVYMTNTSFVQGYANGYYGADIASFPMNGINSFISSTTVGSTVLSPEMTSESEFGLNLQFFQGRIGIDASFYNRETSDQIFTLPVDPAIGYTSSVMNFGAVQNRGVELVLNTTPVKTKNLRWDLNFNFAKNNNKVLSMPSSLEGGKVPIYTFSAGNDAVYMYAQVGKPMGEYYTYLPQYVTDKSSKYYGRLIVDANGQPVLGNNVEDTGLNMNSDWTGGVTTSLSSHGFTLTATLDVRYGGTMFSRTKNLMQFTGNGIITTYNDRKPFIIPNSVQQLSNGSFKENITPLKLSDGSYQKYFNDYGYGYGGLAYLLDRTYTKIRNITLTYELPRKLVKPLYLSGISISAFVNNPFVWTASNNYYVDPESTTTGTDLAGQFGELYANPSSRIYGFNLSIKY